MIRTFVIALAQTVRRWALNTAANALDSVAVTLEGWACKLSDAADSVRAKA